MTPQQKEELLAISARKDYSEATALRAARIALNWILRPKHSEPDASTRLACAQHRAGLALQVIEDGDVMALLELEKDE